jgi:O-glycosyl hydrolase
MKKESRRFFSIILCLIVSSLLSQAQIKITISPENRYSEIEGWGISLCWWAHMVGQWKDEKKIDEIVDLLTLPDKVNMNIFRYNIGGGDHPDHYSIFDRETKTFIRKGHMANGKGYRTEMEGFKAGPNEPYNWEADAGQRKVMLKIREKRPDAIFEAFSNSPPYWMTYSGCSGGNTPADTDNLKPEYYDAFCDYLIDICKHYKEVYGLEFKTLEPFNESASDFWHTNGTQEGCHFDPVSQIKLLHKLYPKLQASGLKNTIIAASDETALNVFLKVMQVYIEDGSVLDKIGQINVHTYAGNDRERVEVRNLIEQIGMSKKFWQSETGSGGSGLTGNIQLLQRLFRDMNLMRPTAWLDWQFMEELNDTWCQIRGDFIDETYYIVKNLYVRMQVTRFIKQGYTIIESGGEEMKDVLAAISPDRSELVISLINSSDTPINHVFDLSKFQLTNTSVKVYRTSVSEDCAALTDLRVEGSVLNYNAPDQSVTTFVLKAKPA